MVDTVGPGGGGAMYSPAVSPHLTSPVAPPLVFLACDMGGLYRTATAGAAWELLDGRKVNMRTTLDRSVPPRLLPAPRVAFHPAVAGVVVTYGDLRGLNVSQQNGDPGTWVNIKIGTTASPTGANIPWASSSVTAIQIDPTGRLFVGTTNGAHYHDLPWSGNNWRDCGPAGGLGGGEVIGFVIVPDPLLNQMAYLLATRGIPGTPTAPAVPGGVYRSLDQGATWQDVTGNLPATWNNPAVGAVERRINGIAGGGNGALHPNAVVYVTLPSRDAAGFQGGVWRSETLGTTWASAMGAGLDTGTAPRVPQYECLAASPNNPNLVYVSAFGRQVAGSAQPTHNTVYRSQDRGATWQPVFTRPVQDPSFAAGTPVNVQGGWLDFDRPGFGGPAISLTVHQHNPGPLGPNNPATLVSTNLGMAYLSTDGGGSWRAVYTSPAGAVGANQPWASAGLEVTTAWRYYVQPQNLHFICYTDLGFARSTDGGDSWRYDAQFDPGSQPWRSNLYELAIDPDPTRAGHLWAAASNQHDIPYGGQLRVPPQQGGIIFSTNNGASWAKKNDASLPSLPAVSIVLDPTSPVNNRQLWVAMFGDGVYFSSDDGVSWTRRSTGLELGPAGDPNRNVYRLHRHPDGTLFCALTGRRLLVTPHTFLQQSGLFMSTNGGLSWTCITEAPYTSTPLNLWHLMDYAVHPANSSLIYLCTASVPGRDGQVFKTTTKGADWGTPPGPGLPPPAVVDLTKVGSTYQSFLQAFAPFFDETDPSGNTVHVTTTTHGTWTSRDGGAGWKEARALPYLSTQRITADPQRPGVVYTTTFGAGVWAPPDVYVRDNPQDTGAPHGGPLSISPDIIIRNATVADPQAAFGEGSGTENDVALSDPVLPGQDHFVYVRMRNRGRLPARNVRATVYWATAATLVTPPWTAIGSASLATVDPGDKLTVAGPITWPAAQLPPPGHYCFVAVLDAGTDPAPDPSTIQTWTDFVDLVRYENNVTWHNFDVVKLLPFVGAKEAASRPFLAAGAPDRELRMDLEFGVDPPAPFHEVEVLLELPVQLLREARLPADVRVVKDRTELARVPLAGETVRIAAVPFPAGSRTGCRLLLRPRERAWKDRDVYVRQLYDGVEVGRVTWRLTASD